MPNLTIDIPDALMRLLEERHTRTGESIAEIALAALTRAFDVADETLYQVSTSTALVEGVFDGSATVGDLKEHGDFGIGTFDNLDGELVAVDGNYYQVRGHGEVRIPDDLVEVPFAVVTRFKTEREVTLARIGSFDDLAARLDQQRQTDNLFYAVRLDGLFTRMKTRSVFPAAAGETLVEAAADQAEFALANVEGTAVGFWTPDYARAVGVPGWHIHFLTADRSAGGHVLDCEAGSLRARLQDLADVRIAMPDTAAFLAAKLDRDPSAALTVAERERQTRPSSE
jgi:acetolactate decarboxylase